MTGKNFKHFVANEKLKLSNLTAPQSGGGILLVNIQSVSHPTTMQWHEIIPYSRILVLDLFSIFQAID